MMHSEYPLGTFFDLVTLTFELDLDILPLDPHPKMLVLMSVLSAVRVAMDRQTHDVKTITLVTSQTSWTWDVLY